MHFKYKTALFCLFFAGEIVAQQELMLNSLPDVWHSNSVNPAFYPKNKRFFIGLPAYSIDLSHSGDIAYKDIFREDGDRTVIDLDNAIGKLEPENEVFFDQRIETVSLGIRSKNDLWGLQVGHAILFNGWVKYPKELAELLWYGNAPYVGRTLQIGPQTDISDWHEWNVGLSRRLGKVNLAARFKYLTGANALQSDDTRTQISVYTDPDIYQLTLKTNYTFNSSSIVEAIDTSGFGYDFNVNSFGGAPSSQNGGFAFDLGFDANLSENLSINASVLNLGGKINWKRTAASFITNEEYTYEGAEISGLDIINGSDSLDFDAQLDTLNDIFQFRKTEISGWETELPLRIFAGLNFKLSEKWSLGVTGMYQNHYNRTNTALGVSARWQPIKWLSLGGMYSANSRSASNLGFHLMLQPGPVQVYVMSDNLLNGFSPRSSPAVNFRVGGAVAF